MNLRDLMTKLDTIAEADDARAQYDKFKADDAKSAAIAQVKKMLAPNGMQNFIDPKDGIVKWQETMRGDSGGNGDIREFPFDWYKKGQNADFFNILKTAGLEIVPVDRKMLFGTSQVAGIKGGPQALTDLDKPVAPVVKPPEGGGGGKPTGPRGEDTIAADAAKLEALTLQLDASLGGGGGKPDTKLPPTPPPNWKPPINPQTNKPFSWKEFLAATAVSAMPGAVIGGVPGAAATGLTGGAVDAYHQLHKQQEGIEFNSSISQALTESFGYEFETAQVDEASWTDPLGASAPTANTSNMRVGGTNWTASAHDPNLFSNGQGATKTYQDLKGTSGVTKLPPATAAEAPKIAAGLEKAGVKTVAPDVAKAALKAGGGKILSKLLPGVGLVVGTIDAIKRAEEGDWTGAAMAGASAMLSLVPGVGGVAAMGLDAANLARDYKAGKFSSDGGSGAPTGTTTGTTTGGGDAKLVQLQKMIGAKPDGLMGPETKAKLQAWQQKNGLTPDGMPGPLTYGKAGIKEQQQTVAEGIRNLQERLALIETKSIIRESIKGQHYFLDANTYFLFNESGEMITDLTTIAAINEAHANGEVDIEEGLWSDAAKGVMKYGGDAVNGVKNFVGSAVKGGANPAAAAKLAARDSEKLAAKGLSKSGLKTGAAIAKNPKTAAALAIGGGAGLGYALGGEKPTETPPGGGGGGGGGGSETGTTTTDTPTTTTDTPTTTDPKVADLVKQIKDLMASHGDDDTAAGNSPVWQQATSHARAVLDKTEKTSADQTKSDVAAAQTVKPGYTPPSVAKPMPSDGGQGASKTGTTTGTPILNLNGAADLSKMGVKESDDELARWLKIARG